MSGIDLESMLSTIHDLVAFSPRASGTSGGEAAAYYVHERFEAAGLDRVWFEETDTYQWTPTAASLDVDGEAFDVMPVLHSALPAHNIVGDLGTGPQGIHAR
ncbi:MAG: hypothetical protein GX678_04855, partial [Actinomycetales bacterium]|nr:hypothetical protein [Actinomycetales bacterium]